MFAGESYGQVITLRYTGIKEIIPACPVEIQQIIKECWSYHPSDRPSAKHILEKLEKLVEPHNKYFLENGIEHGFYITSPIVYRQRCAGNAVDCDINEDLPPREKLFALLKASHLASPQLCYFAQKTEYPEHLSQEWKRLIKSGLDTEKFFNVIKANINQHHSTEPLMADIILLLQEIGLKDDKYYKVIFEFPQEKKVIYDVLSYLQSENSRLCTRENFDFIIEEVSYLSKILPRLKALKTLDQNTFEQVMYARGAEVMFASDIIKEGQHFLMFKPLSSSENSSVDLTIGSSEYPLQIVSDESTRTLKIE